MITSEDIRSKNKNIPQNKNPGLNGFTVEFHQTLKELTPIFVKFFQKNRIECYSHTNTREQCYKKRQLQVNMPDEHIAKSSQ